MDSQKRNHNLNLEIQLVSLRIELKNHTGFEIHVHFKYNGQEDLNMELENRNSFNDSDDYFQLNKYAYRNTSEAFWE